MFLLITILTIFLFFHTFYSKKLDDVDRQAHSTSPSPFNISGLSFSNYQTDQLISKVQVNQLYIRPRKLGPFTMKSVNELFMQQAYFQFYLWPESEGNLGGASLGDGLASSMEGITQMRSRGIGHIVRGKVRKMALDIYRQQQTYISLRSAQAVFDFNRKETRFRDAILKVHTEDFQLTSDLIVWDDEGEFFYVPGNYLLKDSHGEHSGRKLRIPLEK